MNYYGKQNQWRRNNGKTSNSFSCLGRKTSWKHIFELCNRGNNTNEYVFCTVNTNGQIWKGITIEVI